MIDPKTIEEWTAADREASPAEKWQATLREPGYALPRLERAPGVFRAADARLMELSREALPALLRERTELIALLRDVEWRGTDPQVGSACCPCCWAEQCEGHAPDCRLAAAIR